MRIQFIVLVYAILILIPLFAPGTTITISTTTKPFEAETDIDVRLNGPKESMKSSVAVKNYPSSTAPTKLGVGIVNGVGKPSSPYEIDETKHLPSVDYKTFLK
ncbi:hypothetical protein Fcan01_05399 [Folsomia candida]|uniref:Uncharacterized protein n=1 Tax=Folsomia candida TaxID=158441 RepID=A0A226EQH3_FOLCA|nr:hypothetical protein Fcan01_05399 [Folsomia candida]